MKKGIIGLLTLIFSIQLTAQETLNDAGAEPLPDGAWYSSPWIWVVGAAIIIIVLVALSKDKKA